MKTLHPSSQFKKDVKRIKIVIALPLTPPFNFSEYFFGGKFADAEKPQYLCITFRKEKGV